METPNKIEISFVREINNKRLCFKLPEVSYGISNSGKECYIYSILNKTKINNIEDPEEEKFIKEISRKLYKLNKGVMDSESKEYLDYKSGKTDYYSENISDVTPSTVLSLIIFLSLLKSHDINIIKGVPYLPVRYLSRDITANNLDDELKKKELKERNDFIQTNITQKFIRTIRRAVYHLDDIHILSYPYEVDEFITLKINREKVNINNELVNEVIVSSKNIIK